MTRHIWPPSVRAFPTRMTGWGIPYFCTGLPIGEDGQLGGAAAAGKSATRYAVKLVGIEQMDDRALVYFCRTPIRERGLRTGPARPIVRPAHSI